jgi:hypothetical protein
VRAGKARLSAERFARGVETLLRGDLAALTRA